MSLFLSLSLDCLALGSRYFLSTYILICIYQINDTMYTICILKYDHVLYHLLLMRGWWKRKKCALLLCKGASQSKLHSGFWSGLCKCVCVCVCKCSWCDNVAVKPSALFIYYAHFFRGLFFFSSVCHLLHFFFLLVFFFNSLVESSNSDIGTVWK